MTNVPPVNEYPTTDTLELQNALDYIPKSLDIVLKALFVGNETEQKIASIGHAIVQAAVSEMYSSLCILALQCKCTI